MKKIALLFVVAIFCSCSKKQADLIVVHGTVYTVNDKFEQVQAFAVKDGKIIATGTTNEIKNAYNAPVVIDAQGKFVYPGFIDAHAHFFDYAESLQAADLTGATTWDEVLSRLTDFAKTHPDGWLRGRGWDQNLWPGKQFPTNEQLNTLFPTRPVILTRIDGHAAIVNDKAFAVAGITKAFKLTGGDMAEANGKLTGVLVDNAVDLVSSKVPGPDGESMTKWVAEAEKNCFAVGLTTIDDCGLGYKTVEFIEKLQKQGALKMKLYVMLSDSPENYDYLFKRGAIKTDRLNVRSFKVYADGALGSRGACLLQPYSDKPDKIGFLLSDQQHFADVAKKIAEHNFQMCTHAIGDSANRVMLKIYADVLKGKNDKRWRIEHAQIINKADFNMFGANSIVPSVQPTHATSDMYWAGDRLGAERLKGGYAYKQLLEQNGWMPLGTDFPVEKIDPMLTFFAATARKDIHDFPANGFQMENAITPEQALRGMTIWAAKANFEEKEKGSLEVGKFADFVIMDKDLIKGKSTDALKAKVSMTYVNGEKVYSSGK